MARLLDAQEKDKTLDKDELYEFALFLVEKLLDIYHKDLLPSEDTEIKEIVKDWAEK